jgi:hypothetical protein
VGESGFCAGAEGFRRAGVEGSRLTLGVVLHSAPLFVDETSGHVQFILPEDEKDDDDGYRDTSETIHLLHTTFFIYN